MADEMTRLAELGEALSPDEIPMERLRARAMPGTGLARRWARPVVVLAAAASAAVAAGAVMLAGAGSQPAGPSTGTPQPAAYEVRKNADGSVTFTVHELRDLDGATQALNAAGIAGRVLVNDENCTTRLNNGDLVSADFKSEMTGEDTVVVSSSDYPPGGGVLIVVLSDAHQPADPSVVKFVFTGEYRIPDCVNFEYQGAK